MLEQASRRALGARDLGAAESQAGGGIRFQRAVERVVESPPPQVQPRKIVVAGQQRARGHVPRAERGAPGARPVALYDGRLGTMQGGQRLLDIDAGVRRQDDVHAAATGEDVRPHGGAQL